MRADWGVVLLPICVAPAVEDCRGFGKFRLPLKTRAAIGIVAGGAVAIVELRAVCEVRLCKGFGGQVPALLVCDVLRGRGPDCEGLPDMQPDRCLSDRGREMRRTA